MWWIYPRKPCEKEDAILKILKSPSFCGAGFFCLCDLGADFAAEIFERGKYFFVHRFHFRFGEGAIVGTDDYFEGEGFFPFGDI